MTGSSQIGGEGKREQKISEEPPSPRAASPTHTLSLSHTGSANSPIDTLHPSEEDHHIDLLFEAQEVFQRLDADGSGVIEGAELFALATWVTDNFRPGGMSLNKNQKKAMLESISVHEKQHTGLDFDQFSHWFIPMASEMSADALR